MAPVTATSTGFCNQFIDDDRLSSLLERLSAYDTSESNASSNLDAEIGNADVDADAVRIDVEGLVGELERWHQWKFEETADLFEWIKPLNAMDAALRQIMKEFPALLLIGPMKRKEMCEKEHHNKDKGDNVEMEVETETETNAEKDSSEALYKPPLAGPQAESELEVNSVPPSIIHATSTILRFLSTLLRHAMHKLLFNSVTELSNLLAAADDGIAALALEVLSHLAAPPLVHRLQSQETSQHTTVLHSCTSSVVHSRLMALAKGWGTRGCGLGLATCVTTDDSLSGQGSLPLYAGEVDYDFLPPSSSQAVTVKLSAEDIIVSSNSAEFDSPPSFAFAVSTNASLSSPDRQNEKRRKMASGPVATASRQTKPTAHLFFQCLNQIGSRSKISTENLFGLLAHLRLAASFHSQALRTAAVQRRMHALMAVLYAHPSQDVLAGYFHAQPELCTEIGDLVRPIVSSNAISATGISRVDEEEGSRRQAAIASIVDPAATSNIPYHIRAISLEVFTALVARKDDAAGAGLSPVARQTHVLAELGVGKGQFLGLLPTLIRYSLASLNVFLSKRSNMKNVDNVLPDPTDEHLNQSFDIEELGLDLGLTFLEAIKPPTADKDDMEAKALEFIEIVLFLASSIVSVTTGTASLTDCGLVPALVSTIALTSQKQLPFGDDNKYCSSLLKFITAQAIQILEGAIITHNPALLAFHDLKAVDLLVTLLHSEFKNTCKSSEIGDVQATGSTRVLLFSILNCLTVVFHHQETNPRSTNPPLTPGEVLRRPEMTEVLMGIMKHVHSYGGVLGALATTILSDIMNSDPKIVHYVYECGLADTFFRMIKGSQYEEWNEKSKPNGIMNVQGDEWHEPDIPPAAELIMSLPNIVIALSLTEEGRERVLHVNPMPELLSLMCISRFSMPYSRCMLNDMASIIGSGLDELMRHVQNSKLPVIKSLVAMIERVVYLGEKITEIECDINNMDTNEKRDSRIYLMHYASNIGQALEHVLQNEDNCGSFVDAGGIEAILKLHPLLVVRGTELLAHISCQSSPTLANLSHSTASTSLTTAIKRCAVNDNPSVVIKKITLRLKKQLDSLHEAKVALEEESPGFSKLREEISLEDTNEGSNILGILEDIPSVPLHRVNDDVLNSNLLRSFAAFLLEIINTEWLTQVISEVIRVSCQRTNVPDVRSLDRGSRLEWQKDLSSNSFRAVFERLGLIYRTSMLEVCRIRSKLESDEREVQRCKSPGDSNHHPASYRLRIVCSDGGVVRDGIDIDSCESVTNLEMGEEIEAFDRCINRSGIMRYRTSWGWVSEQTRGHGREPISEVLGVTGSASHRKRKLHDHPNMRKPIDFGIPDLCSAGASILARFQNSQCSLYASLSRLTMVGARMRSPDSIPPHIGTLVCEVGGSLRANFNLTQDLSDKSEISFNSNCIIMYLGNMLSAFHSSLYEERRDKQYLNVMILCNSLYHDGLGDSFLLLPEETKTLEKARKTTLPSSGFYNAIRLVIRSGLSGVKEAFSQLDYHSLTKQRLSRAVASSFPSAVSLLRRLSSQNLLIDPQLGASLHKLNLSDFAMFLDDPDIPNDRIFSFRHNSFARSIHCQIGAITHEFWSNPDLKYCPAYVLNPILSLVLEVLTCVEQSTKKSGSREDGDDHMHNIRRALSYAQESSATERSARPQETAADEPSAAEETVLKPKSDEAIKKDAEALFDSKLLQINKECHQSYQNCMTKIAFDLIEGPTVTEPIETTRLKCSEDLQDTEANTIVISSFILDVCSKTPVERSKTVEQVIHRMIALMDISPKASNAKVSKGKEYAFSALCHSAVLLLRALPKTRIVVLENSCVSLMVHCLRSVTSKIKSTGLSSLPSWVSPSLLFLEVMAQPMALPPKRDDKDISPSPDGTQHKSNRRNDYEKVVSEHKKQRTLLSKASKRINSALAQKLKGKGKNENANGFTAFSDFPTYAPLINQESADHCLSLCMQLLRHHKRQKQNQDDLSIYLPAQATHATILLLTRILSFHKVASRCLRMGGADFLLSLYPRNRFKGHVALITLALRRMMEDESVLQTAMEIEIRSVVTKLLKKQNDASAVPGKSFVKALSSFICRDPVIFLRAAASSISVKGASSNNGVLVVLLPAEERARNSKILSDCFRMSLSANSSQGEHSLKGQAKAQTKAFLSSPTKENSKKKLGSAQILSSKKTPLNRSSKKSQKKGKQDKVLINGTPVNHVTVHILTEIIKSFQRKRNSSNLQDIPFLCVFELVEIIGDLLLAIPSCSSAICNYRIPGAFLKGKSQPRNIINYLLHFLLPQPRDVSNHHMHQPLENHIEDEGARKMKRDNYMKIKIAQSSARLLVALVARVGEGRRKVISELTLALNEHNLTSLNEMENDKRISALQAWGELCLGLAAPRRTPASTDDSSLSFEVLKVMFEYGMSHSLMNAIRNVTLEHPLAPSTCANLLKPLEILTRPTVIDTLQSMAEKEEKKKSLAKSQSGGESLNSRPKDSQGFFSSQQENDGMLTADFDANTTTNEDIMMEDGYDSSSSEEVASSSDEDPMLSESEDSGSDSSVISDSESNNYSGDEEDQLEQMEVVDEDENIMSDSGSEVESDEDEEEDDAHAMEMDYEDSYAHNFQVVDEDNDDFLDVDGEGDDESGNEDAEEEGWTNIDSVGLGGMLFSSRNGANPVGRPRQGGLMIEAAASVLNNILRSGDIQMDAIAEIEESLGIRIPPPGRGFDGDNPRSRTRAIPMPSAAHTRRRNAENSNDADLSPSNQGPVGETPVIHQNNPPDNGFSSMGSLGRNGDINFMEYLFGGAVFGPSRIYYDPQFEEHGLTEEFDRARRLLPVPSSVDIQLFPGGPTSCTHTQVVQSLHCLVAGVSLAPLNSLVSINMRVDDQTIPRSRRLNEAFGGGWTDVITHSRGNIIRLNRTPITSTNTNSEQVPHNLDASDFSLAFERTLNNFVVSETPDDEQEEAEAINPGTDFFRPRTAVNSEESNESNGQEEETNGASAEPSVGANANDNDISNPTLPAESTDGETLNNTVETSADTEMQQVADSTAANDIVDTSVDTELQQAAERTASINTLETPVDTNMQQASEPAAGENISDTLIGTQTQSTEQIGDTTTSSNDPSSTRSSNVLTCPPGMDSDVFAQLPLEMQQEIVGQQVSDVDMAAELDEASGLDPEVLAALPENMRREVIEEERSQRRLREQEIRIEAPADPSHAEDLDGASFIATLAPDLREEILMTADEEFLNSLPPDLIAEAQLLRERALMSRHRREMEASISIARDRRAGRQPVNDQNANPIRRAAVARKRTRTKVRVDCNRPTVTYSFSKDGDAFGPLISPASMKALVDMMFLLSPVRPQKLLQKLFQNLCFHRDIRKTIAITFIALLNDEPRYALDAIQSLEGESIDSSKIFPSSLIGTALETSDFDSSNAKPFFRKNRASSAATAIASNLPTSTKRSEGECLSPVVARRIVGTMSILTKNASRLSLDILGNFDKNDDKSRTTCLDTMLSLLAKQKYSLSSSNLEDLLGVIESICSPLSTISIHSSNDTSPSKKDMEVAASAGKEYVPVPRAIVSPNMLKLLCSILRLESCKDSLFARVSNIARRLCRVESNRKCILEELASVAHGLGSDAIRDLKSLRIRLNNAVQVHYDQLKPNSADKSQKSTSVEHSSPPSVMTNGTPSSAVTLSTNNTELKLLRVLQTLQSLCIESNGETKRSDEIPRASKELVVLLQGINLDDLWEQLNACLSTVSVLEGVTKLSADDDIKSNDEEDDDGNDSGLRGGKKLQNSVAGLLTRFLPTIETFFVVNACSTIDDTVSEKAGHDVENLVGGESLLSFIGRNKVLINALLRSSPSLLDKGLRAMVQIPRCRSFLDFDVKRYWFKQQVRKLRSQASRRHGNLRLNIRRQYVFEDAYRQLSMRTADELRGRLHITFASEEGVDAGGLSREFFGILAKEMFNPNYALFTSTEDGCTFQPNPHSSINREHLDYFRFVGRIVGKAVADGFLLDAHFTRSLYKHMLGIKPTYHDMQAIDPDYYKNLKMILDYNLEDIGLDLTFSTVTHWFGRSQTVDLVPNGRNIPVTDKDKEKYVSLVCQHRMTTAIEEQIKAYSDGFYELVKPSLISIFTPKELELLISGMPDIDILDLKKNTEYHGYRPADKEIGWFWNIMFSLTKSEKAAFLQFVTGSSKVPLNGFSELQGMRGTQKFSIHKANGSIGALMSAHTCFNSLDLPSYKNEDELKQKLLYAIKEGAGSFQFS